MPTRYKRKLSAERASWSENDLNNAITAINSGAMGVNAMGDATEAKLVVHIKKTPKIWICSNKT